MRFESVRVGDVDCVVRVGGPRPQKVFVYGYPVEGNSNLLTDALSGYGEWPNQMPEKLFNFLSSETS